jgi:hypothetical protein
MTVYKIAILAIGLVFSAGQAFACSCAPERSAAEQADRYPLIFVGTAMTSVDVTPAPPPVKRSFWNRLQFWKPAPVPPPNYSKSFETSFTVKRMLKGEEADTVTLQHIGNNGALCGRNFIAGDEYLILASAREDGTFTTSLCALPQFPLAAFEAALAPASTPVPTASPAGLAKLFGTWGVDKAQCSLPQEVRGAPFILTQNSFDQYETHCDTSFTPAQVGGWNMAMQCSVEGDRQNFLEWVAVYDGVLLRGSAGGKTAQEFIRCADQ